MDVILKDIGLSELKFKLIISLLRKLGRIPSDLDSEWSMRKIRSKIAREPDFAYMVAELLVDGKRDERLKQHIPRYYLDMLNYRKVKNAPRANRRVRYWESLIGTYEDRKEQKVEGKIQAQLEAIQAKHGLLDYIKAHPLTLRTNIGLFVVPNFAGAGIVIMSSFQETTSSDQWEKADRMLSAYEQVCRHNDRHGENRTFVNFVDGGGWLARKRDLERLVEHCHYFINLQHLDMLESIVLQHVPEKYLTRKPV